MTFEPIEIDSLKLNPFSIFDQKWFLLTAGDFSTKKWNCMTISWGSMGIMWSKPFIQVVVRPTRYTFEFIRYFPDFTVCAFPEKYKPALLVLGSKSGRLIDKINASTLTPTQSALVNAPGYKEADLIIECRKIYSDSFNPSNFLDPQIEGKYPTKDYHTVFYGEILAISGDQSLYH